jgi:hypothetical protein
MQGGPSRAQPVVTRSKLVLEIASELVGEREWLPKQARITLRPQGDHNPWDVCLFGSDAPNAIEAVARGEAQLAIINPAEPLALALRGRGPYVEPVPVRIITIIPSLDQFAFAVTAQSGITSLEEIRDRRYPLRVSMRAQPDHSDYLIVHETLSALGFSLGDIVSWGGQVRRHGFPPDVGAVERGEADAIFDEAVGTWVGRALDAGMRMLPLGEPLLQKLEGVGLRRGVISQEEFPKLPHDVISLDFSGWPVFTRADVSDEFVRACCSALEARKDRIPWQGDGPLPLHRMCFEAEDTPLTAPLHPAAEAFWRERGYLK